MTGVSNFLFESNREGLAALSPGRMAKKRGVLVVSHPRSGTHLTIDLLRRNFPDLSVPKPLFAPLSALYVSLDALLIHGPRAPAVRRSVYGLLNHHTPLIKAHWVDQDFDNLRIRSPSIADWITGQAWKIYVVRNPSEVVASLYGFEEQLKDPVIVDWARWLDRKSSYWARHVESWAFRPDVLLLRFEDLIAHPDDAVIRVEQLTNLPTRNCEPALPEPTGSLWRNRLQRLSRRPKSTEILSPKPKQPLRDVFPASELDAFRRNVGPLCAKLGYTLSG